MLRLVWSKTTKKISKEEFKLMQKQLKLFKDCKSPCMIFAEVTDSVQGDPLTPLSKRPKLSNDDWKKLIYSLNEISKMMIDENMPLAYHHHMGTVIETEEDTRRLIENTEDTVGLLIDTGHMLFAQGNSINLVESFYERLIHVHCKDIRKKYFRKIFKKRLNFQASFFRWSFYCTWRWMYRLYSFKSSEEKKIIQGGLWLKLNRTLLKQIRLNMLKLDIIIYIKLRKRVALKLLINDRQKLIHYFLDYTRRFNTKYLLPILILLHIQII